MREQIFSRADSPFNTAHLVVRDSYVEHWLKGRKVLAYDLSDPALLTRIAGSRFRDYPQFGKQHEGCIVLQHHSTDAWFRTIRVQELSG